MTRVDEYGVLNSYANEPNVYFAQYPSAEQRRRYFQQGGLASLVVSLTILIAFSVSHIS